MQPGVDPFDDSSVADVAADVLPDVAADVLADVLLAFHHYEAALIANDVATMDSWFEDRPDLVRFGIAEIQHGLAEIAKWRATATAVPASRRHERVTPVVLSDDLVVIALEFRNGSEARTGRQTQVWQRRPAGWRIVHAHVSMIDL
jgi:ketosteroid isomerase-like protein